MTGPEGNGSALIVTSILPYPAASGGQLRTLRLTEAMERAGVRPHLLITSGADPADAAVLRQRGWGVEVFSEPRPGLGARLRQHLARRPSPFLGAVDSRVRELVAVGVCFVQLENAQNSYYAQAAGERPTVLSTHNVDAELIASQATAAEDLSQRLRLRLRAGAMAATERRAARACDAVLCVSEHDAAAFRSLGAERVLLVPNGVDEELFEIGPPPGEDSVLFFGLLSYPPNATGLTLFLDEGWPELRRSRPRARLRIAGGGAGPELRDRVGRSPGAELLGRVPSIAEELRSANLVLVPVWQGGGTRLKVLESLGAARPVVGTPLGVERIGFEDGRHGLLADDPMGLAAAAAVLLSEPARARHLGAAGRELAEGFRWSRVLEPAERLYAELLSRSAR